MKNEKIIVRGAREHNLKHVDLDIPKRKFVVFTGPSGSGKSSLAFDTLFAEGQRRYVESLSVYARQFLGRMSKPECDEIRGLSPTISIEQKSTGSNPRSTVGTITEIHDYLRVLYARVGHQHCHTCGREVSPTSPQRIVQQLGALEAGTKFQVLAPLVRNRKGEFREVFERLRKRGLERARVDSEWTEISAVEKLRKTLRHNVDVVVDRLISRPTLLPRIGQAVETALELGEGRLIVLFDSGPREGEEQLFSTHNWCSHCEIAFPELTQQSFSFNSPLGQCVSCMGLGHETRVDDERLVPDTSLAIDDGAFAPLRGGVTGDEKETAAIFAAWCDARGIDRTVPWRELPEAVRHELLRGSREAVSVKLPGRKRASSLKLEGLAQYVARRRESTDSDRIRELLDAYMRTEPCSACSGTRLRPESRAVTVGGRSIADVSAMSISDATAHVASLTFADREAVIAAEFVAEIAARLRFLRDVGVGYLSLDRSGPSLSGGEAQRIRLAGQLGSDLTGVLYVLDEPSIGLHQRDNRKLLDTLTRLRDQGNTVVVVEHDRETIEAADWVVDFGPGAGVEGGHVAFSGPPDGLRKLVGNITGDYLSERRRIEVPATRRAPNRGVIRVVGAREHNLRNLTIEVPIATFTCITGVSGAGKSTFLNDILWPELANRLYGEIRRVGLHDRIEGLEPIDKAIRIDQQPIGRTPRSNPATYTKLFDEIRGLFSQLPDSRMYGYTPGRFSFNVKGGRCEACQGAGQQRIEMGFLADAWVMCDVCRGRRFNDATLRVRYRGRSIADVLEMPVSEAAALFEAHPIIRRRLQTMVDVGLGYMSVGQPSTTLSGGEAQRIKLSRELSKIATGDTLYILDEPSTGLHFEDIRKLLDVVNRLVDAGNTVVMIEHNLDIIKVADHVIDLGPEGGDGGGEIVASGTPEQVAQSGRGHTAGFLAEVLR